MKQHLSIERRQSSAPRRRKGFTLIELVITMVVAAMLAAIAIPAYSSYVRKSRRTDAKTALLDLASLEERYFSTQNAYSANASDLGYSAWPATVGSGYYQINAPTVVAAVAPSITVPAGTPATYSFTAVPVATSSQASDVLCASFTINSAGQQTATGTDPNPNQDCWH